MSEPNWNEISEVLRELESEAREHPVAMRGTGVFFTDPGYATEKKDLAGIHAQLAKILKTLQQSQARLDFKQFVATRTPRHLQWQNAPLKRERKKLGDVYKQANDLLALVLELEARSRNVNPQDLLAEWLSPKVEQAQDQFMEHVQHKGHTPNIDIKSPTVQNLPLDLIVGLLWGYASWKMRKARQKSEDHHA